MFKKSFKNCIDFAIVFLLAIISLKKGGFYKTDSMVVSVSILIISIIYIVYNYITNNKSQKKFDIVALCLLLLSFCYTLPVVFSNFASLSSSLFEIVRYFCVYIIYKIVKNSDRKNIYINCIIFITIIQCFIGIDGLACRCLNKLLNIFDSGYLSIDLTRMSSTIQYANVLAILCAVSLIFVIDKIVKNNKSILYNTLQLLLAFILFSSLVLTASRSVLVIFTLAFIIYLVKNKKDIIYILTIGLFQIIEVIIYTSLVYQYIQQKPYMIYILFLLSLIINITISFVILLIKRKIIINDKKHVIIYIGITVFMFTYILIGLNISKPLVIYSNSKDEMIQRRIYNFDINKTNNLNMKIDTLQEDTRYEINIFEIDKEFRAKHIKKLQYFDNTCGKFDISFIPTENTNSISIQIKCEKGSFKISNMNLNEKNIILDYYLLPSEIVFKLQDALHGSSSVKDRLEYIKDSVKIVTMSPKNFIIGIGGDGFSNMYERVQTYNYVSTKVHNSFIQIFVESGILGFSLVLFAIFISIKRSKFNISMLALLLFVIHSIFDLNMSFMLTMLIFAILLAILEEKNTVKINKNFVILYSIEKIVFYLMLTVSLYISVGAILAFNTKILKIDDGIVNLNDQINVVKALEDRVNFDSSEYEYRSDLATGYNTYITLLSSNIRQVQDSASKVAMQKELINVLNNSLKNANLIKENDKFSKYALLEVSDIYFRNLGYFVALNYPDNNDYGYKIYLDEVLKNVDEVKDKNKFSKNAQKAVLNAYNTYFKKLIEANNTIKSSEVDLVIDKLSKRIDDLKSSEF